MTDPAADQIIKSMQIIAVGMIVGVIILSVVAIAAAGAFQEASTGTVMSIAAGLFAAISWPGSFYLPARIRPNAGATSWNRVLLMRLIVGFTMLELAAVINLVACFLEHNVWSLAFVAVSLLLMMIRFPTRRRIEDWISAESQIQKFNQISRDTTC